MNFRYLDGKNSKADADNQQERLQEQFLKKMMEIEKEQKHKRYYDRLKKLQRKYLYYYVAGFVDGEASFSVAMTKQKYVKKGEEHFKWILNPVFQVYQHENNKDILLLLRDYVFQTGRLHRKTSPYNVFTYSVENHRTLHEKIVPFFRKYRLAVKDEDFEKFADIIARITKKEHLTIEGFKNIVDIAFTMNVQGKQRKYSKEYIFETLPAQFNVLEESSETTR